MRWHLPILCLILALSFNMSESCEFPMIENLIITSGEKEAYVNGDVVNVKCNGVTYTMTGPDTYTCFDGSWMPEMTYLSCAQEWELTCGSRVSLKMSKNYAVSVLGDKPGNGYQLGLDPFCHEDLGQTADDSTDCVAIFEEPDQQFNFNFDLANCNPNKKMVDGKQSYQYSIMKIDSTDIARKYTCEQVTFSCDFTTTYRITSTNHMIPIDVPNESATEAIKTVKLGLYLTDASYNPLSEQKAYQVGDYIHATVKFDPAGPADLVIQASTCYAAHPYDNTVEKYAIIKDDGCAESKDDDSAVAISKRSGDSVNFKYKSFYWPDSASLEMNLVCNVKICRKVEGGEECNMDPEVCTSSRYFFKYMKRSADDDGQAGLGMKTVSIGPILVAPQDPCMKNNGGCEDKCNVVNGEINCYCRRGYRSKIHDPTKCEPIMDQAKLAEMRKAQEKAILDYIGITDLEEENEDHQQPEEKDDDVMISMSKTELMELQAQAHVKDMLLMGVSFLILFTLLVASVIFCRRLKKWWYALPSYGFEYKQQQFEN